MKNGNADDSVSRGLVYCFFVVVLAVSAVGFLTGTNLKPEQIRPHSLHTPTPRALDSGAPARSYSEMRLQPEGDNNSWQESLRALEEMQDRLKPEILSRDQARQKHRNRRAYEGAPPTIPHFVQPGSTPECLACHTQGPRFGKVHAALLPHGEYSQCNQCHVPESGPFDQPMAEFGPDPRAVENSFQGLDLPGPGPRAWPGAPPQIPHGTQLRENCLSCHGPSGKAPFRTSHPERQNCTQCHTSSAQLDLRPGIQP